MKEYPASNYYTGIFAALLVFTLPLFWFAYISYGFYADGEKEMLFYAILLFSFAIIGIYSCIYKLFFDMPRKYSFDTDGFYLKFRGKTRRFRWADITDCGIVKIRTGNDKYTYWVFFSKRILTQKERTAFLRKTRYERENAAYFEYTKKSPIDELKSVLREDLLNKLEWDEQLLKIQEIL